MGTFNRRSMYARTLAIRDSRDSAVEDPEEDEEEEE